MQLQAACRGWPTAAVHSTHLGPTIDCILWPHVPPAMGMEASVSLACQAHSVRQSAWWPVALHMPPSPTAHTLLPAQLT